MNNELNKVENLPQLVKSLGSIVGAVGSLAPISLHSSNSMSILKGAIQSEIEGISLETKAYVFFFIKMGSVSYFFCLYSPQRGIFDLAACALSMFNIHPQ